MQDGPFMPKATAVWLVQNTTLSFKQIANFCKLHELEVKGIADGDVAKGIKSFKKGMKDPEQDQTKSPSSSEDSNSEKK